MGVSLSGALANAILRPFGDQLGSWSQTPGLFVRFLSAVPSAFIVKMSKSFSPRMGLKSRTKAILLPVGDQALSSSSSSSRCDLGLVRPVGVHDEDLVVGALGSRGSVRLPGVSRSLMKTIFVLSARQLARSSLLSEPAVRLSRLLPFGRLA